MALEPIHMPVQGGTLRLDARGLTLTQQVPGFAARSTTVEWGAVEAGGLVEPSSVEAVAASQKFLLVFRDRRRRRRAFHSTLPASGFAREMALEQLRAALGERFSEQATPYRALRRRLGLTSWWIWPLVVLLMLLLLYAPIACMAGLRGLAR